MNDCKHGRLVLMEGPIHENDNPPIYQCQICNAFVRVTITPDTIRAERKRPTKRGQ